MIRKATRADGPRISAIRFAVRENRPANAAVIAKLVDWLFDNSTIWVWDEDGTVQGFSAADPRDGSICALFVDPFCERRGIGRALLPFACDVLRESGHTTAVLTTEAGTRAERFYRADGWTEVRRKEDGQIVFQKSLSTGNELMSRPPMHSDLTAEIPAAVASADRLGDILRRSGMLETGSLSDVTVDSKRTTILSQITRLRLIYTGEAPGAPSTLILKTSRPERIGKPNAGRREVAFYNDVATTMPTTLVPRCFEATFEPDTGAWHVLLEDLTDSHLVATVWPLPPSIEQCEKIVRARARFHALWWDDARLGTTIGTWLPVDDRQLQAFDAAVTRFFDRVGDLLPAHRRDLYRRLIDRGPELNKRYHSHRDMTVVQGDAHYWNCFLPKDGSDDVRFFDWDSWRADVGTDDLAYMIALHWYPDRRSVLERPLLDLYHATITAHGICRYDRRSLEADYRLSVLWQIATPVWQSNGNIPPVIWWNNLERIMLAVDDLGCCDLLT